MTVNAKKVQGRRTVRYESYGDFIADAEQMALADFQTLGNWSLGQILKHLAQSVDSSIDGAGFSLPAPVRWVMSLLMKKKFLTKPIPAGFKTTKEFTPEETTIEEGLALLRRAVDRQGKETKRADHPGFGKITAQEWTEFNLRHAELHMSFVVPNEAQTEPDAARLRPR